MGKQQAAAENEPNRARFGWGTSIFAILRAEIVVVAILLLGIALRFYLLGAESLWVDEGTSVSVAQLTVPGILADRIFKNPPVYFLILHYWVQVFGDSEFVLRALSALFGSLALLAMFGVGSRLLGRQGGLLSMFLLAISLFNVEFSQEARAYTLMVLLVLLSMYCLIRLFERFSRWLAVGYVLVNAVLLYTHFFGAFVVVAQNLFWLFMFVRRRHALSLTLPLWAALQALTLLLFAPWLRYLLLEVQSMQAVGVWIPAPTAVTIWETLVDYASESVVLLFLFGGLTLYVLVYGRSETNDPEVGNVWRDKTAVYVLLLLWLIAPIALPFLASYVVAPILLPRYTIAASLGWYLLVAAALVHIRFPTLRYALLAFITVLSLLSLSRYYIFTDKQQWREVAAHLETNGEPGDLMLFNPGGIQGTAFGYYFQREDMQSAKLDLSFDLITSYIRTNEIKAQDLDDIETLVDGAQRVWLIQAHSNDTEGIVPQKLATLYETAEQIPYYGIQLSLYANLPGTEMGPAEETLTTQQIRYHLPQAAAVNLVWGIDGWNPLPIASQVMATAVQDNLLVTPMQQDGDLFVAELRLPESASLDYVFQVTESEQNAPVNLWDTNNGQDYQIQAGVNDSVTHEAVLAEAARSLLAEAVLTTQEIRYALPGATAVSLVWGVEGWQALPATYWPPNTEMAGGILYTPMARDGDAFVVSVPAARGTQLDYVFQIFMDNGTGQVELWDTNQRADYALTAGQSGVVVIRPSSSIRTNQLLALISGWGWPLWLGVGLALFTGGYIASRQTRRWHTMNTFFSSRRWLDLRDLMIELVWHDINLRYKSSFLGSLWWSFLNLLVQILVFSFVFRVLLPLDIPNYPAYLFTGLLAWGWFSSSLTASTTVILNGRDLLLRPGVRPNMLLVVTVGSNLVHFLLLLPILLLFLLFSNILLTPAVFWLPFIVVLQFIFSLSLAYFAATFHLMFRGTVHLLNLSLLLLFYLTPIVYDVGRLPARIQELFQLNPVLILLDAYRAVLLGGQPPNFMALLLLLAGSLGLLAVGYRLFLRTSDHFIEES